MSIELVVWRDAHFIWEDDKNPDDYVCRTVGWAKVDGRFLRIEGERTPEGARAVTRVPLENVVKRKKLK